ncbi:zinc-dependent metalloprotease [Crocinitomix catalasitica]|uniref:zinc-dependent metalloprotease n=1 Tax=Crocinitomix catalasitica TaxID=184607 RepID=UPI000484102E|nr:zinc-dependent metalloprotease [Crocinitomix catalasitica]
MIKKTFLQASFLILTLSITNISYGQLFKKNKKKDQPKTEHKSPKKDGMQPYTKVITKDAESQNGLFTVHKIDKAFYYEIPDSLLNREMLMVTRIAKTATGIGFGGGKTNEKVLRWERREDDILLRVVSNAIYAADSLPVHEAVLNSNFEPILFMFPIKALGKDSASVVIDVTNLFDTDVHALGFPESYRKRYKVTRMDDKRSYIDRISAYPINIESRHVKTYNAAAPPSNSSVGAISVEISNSMILLPETPMRRRYFDERVGWFTSKQTDYGDEAQKTKSYQYLDRWRLEVKPEDIEKFKNGELVEPVKPIIYYIDRATPEKWRKYLKEGIEDWQVAFEAAGFKNAIIAMDPPTKEEDPDWSPEDARYSVVRYLASPIPNANGPHVSDPRSGEILESDINWYHNVMTLLHNWFFVQTSAINPAARGTEFDDETMGRLIRFVSSHEVGHTLGLPHNMGSSVAYPVDSLRSPAFTKKYGTAPSIMDYARFNYIAQPGDGDVALMPDIGPYDKYSIAWGYRPILEVDDAKDEKKILDGWILEKAGDPLYRFGKQQFGVIDPSSQTEDLGDNAMKASTYGINNLKIVIPNMMEWIAKDGEDYSDLETLYGQIVGQYNRYMGHVTANIGGVYEMYKTYDQAGAVYTHVPLDLQKDAMDFLQKELFATPTWLLNQDIFNKIEYDGSVERIRKVQVATLNNLLDFGRMARMIENEAINGDSAYALVDAMEDLRKGLWSETKSGAKIDVYRRNLQKAHIEQLSNLMTKEQTPIPPQFARFIVRTNVDASQSDIRSVARAELKALEKDLKSAVGRTSDKMSKYHLEDALAEIDLILNPR